MIALRALSRRLSAWWQTLSGRRAREPFAVHLTRALRAQGGVALAAGAFERALAHTSRPGSAPRGAAPADTLTQPNGREETTWV